MRHISPARGGLLGLLLLMLLGLAPTTARAQQKVGIRTTTPDSTLTVKGGARFHHGVQVGDYVLPAQKGQPGELLHADPAGGPTLSWSTGLKFVPGLGLTTGANQPLAPVTVGSPNTTGIEPFSGQYTDIRDLFLLTAADLTAAGLQAGPLLGFDVEVLTKNSTQPYQGFTVKLGHTALTALTTGAFPPDPLTTVYSGTYTTAVGWNSIPFSQPFVWDGTSNLLVQTCFDNAAITASDVVRQRTTTYNSLVLAFTSVGTTVGCAQTSASVLQTKVPVFRFVPGTRGYVLPNASPAPGQVLVGGPTTPGPGPVPAQWSNGVTFTPGQGLTIGDPIPGGNPVTVGTQNQSIPEPFLAGSYTDSRFLYLLTAADLTAAGLRAGGLTALDLNVLSKGTNLPFVGFTVKLGTTALTTLVTGPYPADPLTTVYSGDYTTALGWNTIPFSQPFLWNGTSNLLLQFCFDNTASAGPGSDPVATRTTSYNSALVNASTTPAAAGCALASGGAVQRMPVLRFTTTTAPYTLPPAGGLPNQVLTQLGIGQTGWRDLPWLRTGANIYRASGKVGIGTATPDSTLTVQGGARFTEGVQIGDYVLPARKGSPGELLQADPAGSADLKWAPGLSYSATQGLTLGANLPTAPVYVGTPNTSTGIPFLGNTTDMRAVFLLTAADLTAAGLHAGPLLELAMNVITKNSTQPFHGFTVKVGTTALTALPTGGGAFPADPLTTVFSADYTTALGWNAFPFSQPFVWDGTSNLLVQFCFDNATTSNLDAVQSRAVGYAGYNLFGTATAPNPGGCALPTFNNSGNMVLYLRLTPGTRGYTLPAVAPAPGQLLTGGPEGTTSSPDAAQWAGLTYTPSQGLTVGLGGVQAPPVTVGTQSGSSVAPFLSSSDARYVYLITAADLTAAGLTAGPLGDLALNVLTKNSTQPFNGLTIKVGPTALTALTSGVFPADPLTTVYSNTYSTVAGWNTFPFSQPVQWDGTSNLLVQFCYDNPTGNNSDVIAARGSSYISTQGSTSGAVGCAIATANAGFGLPIFRFSRSSAYSLPPAGGQPGQVLTQQANGTLAFQTPLPQHFTLAGSTLTPVAPATTVQATTLQGTTVQAGTLTFPAPGTDPAPVLTARTVPVGQGNANERSELILFHANDDANGFGPDLITLRAPAIRLQTYANSGVVDINNNAGSNDRLYIDPAGNVGVGTSTPSFRLEAQSSNYLVGRLSSSSNIGTWLNLTNTSTGGGGFQFISTGANNGEGPNKLLIWPGQNGIITGSGLLLDGATGNLGIGLSAPAVRLHVAGTTRIEGQANALQLVGGGTGSHVYQEFYPEGIANGRKGWFGFPSNGSTVLGLTNEYAAGSIELATGGATRLTVSSSGQFGFGMTPAVNGLSIDLPEKTAAVGQGVFVSGGTTGNANLELRGSTTAKTPFIDFAQSTGDYTSRVMAVNSGLQFYTNGNAAPMLNLRSDGLVEALGGVNLTGNFAFYAYTGAVATGVSANPPNVSIRAAGRVVASEFNAVSDRRLKSIVGLSDNAADLALLTRLRITDYIMRDRARFGERRFKKVIAQEVEEVFPQAVMQQTGFLPDVYATAAGVRAEGDSLLTLTLPTGVAAGATVGQRVKLLGPAGEVFGTVARPSAAGSKQLVVRGAQALAATPSEVFVYGLEHADVRAVDYEALSMLNVSATQELARLVKELQAQNETLRQQAGRAEQRATAAEAATQSFEQRLRELEIRLGTARDK